MEKYLQSFKKVQWAVGSGLKINAWKDNWLTGNFIQKILQLSDADLTWCSQTVSCLIVDNKIQCPPSMIQTLNAAGLTVHGII